MRISSRLVLNSMLSLLLISTFGLALLLSSRGAAHAAGPSIQLSQTVGPPTTVITVSGTGFGTNETITILCLAQVVGTTTSSAVGTFSTAIKIPASTLPGFHEVKAIGQSSGFTAHSPFHVRTDWPQLGFEAQQRGFNPYENVLSSANVSALTLDWSSTTAIQYSPSSPVVANGLVYLGSISTSHKLYAFDFNTGTLKWSYTTAAWVSTPAVFNGLVYIGSDRLYALNATTGVLQWSYSTGGGVSVPTVANGLVYVSSGNQLYALNATTGVLTWNSPLTETLTTPLAVTKQLVYVGSSAAKLYALDAFKGTLTWSYSIPAALTASPVIANGLVYVGSYDPNGSATNLYALNATNGAFAWSYAVGGCGIEHAPAVAKGILYIGSDGGDGTYDNCVGGNLFALDALTGMSIWSTYYGGNSGHNSSPIVANGVLYVSSNDFNYHDALGPYSTALAINLKTGARFWSYTFGIPGEGIFGSSPVVANGVVYVDTGGDSDNLYAFHLPGTTP